MKRRVTGHAGKSEPGNSGVTRRSHPACAEGAETPGEVPGAFARTGSLRRSYSEVKDKTRRGWAKEFQFIGPGSQRKCLEVQYPEGARAGREQQTDRLLPLRSSIL